MILGFVAHVVFWAVLLVGSAELGRRVGAVFVALWVIGYVGSRWIPSGGFLFVSYVAVLDVVLIFLLLKSGIRLR